MRPEPLVPGAGARPLRVLHLGVGNLFGGIETLLVTLARTRSACPAMDPSFCVLFTGRLEDGLRASGAPVVRLPSVRASRPWTVWRARAALGQVLRAQAPDVVLAHGAWVHASLGPAVRRAGVPLAYFAHDFATGRPWVERWAARTRPARCLANTAATRDTLAALFPGVPADVVGYPVEVPSPAPDASAGEARAQVRAELGVGADVPVLIQVSRMEAWKGHPRLLAALATLGELPWELWLVGGAQRPAERVYLEGLQRQVADTPQLAGRVRFLGQRSDVPRLLRAADVFCQINAGPEPFGIVFVEAMAAGLPVVAARMGGAPEVLGEDTGALVEPTPDAVASALRRLLRDAGARHAASAAGRQRARTHFDPAARLAALVGPLRAAAEGRG